MFQKLTSFIWRLLFGHFSLPTGASPARANERAAGAVELAKDESRERRTKMNDAYEKLVQLLDARGVRYLANPESPTIWADFRGQVGLYRVVATVDEPDGLFQVFGYSPIYVPEGCRPAIAETLARANCCLKVGKFEMSYDQGEVRFQAAHILADNGLEEGTIDRLIGTTMSMLDMYLPVILSVIFGNELPKDAIQFAEGGRDGRDEAECDPRRVDE
jgi:hypothetical protein